MPGTSADAAADYFKNMPLDSVEYTHEVIPSAADVADADAASTVDFATDDAETVVDATRSTTAQTAADFQHTQEGLQFLRTQVSELQKALPHTRVVRPALIQKRRKADKAAKQSRKRNRH